MKLTNQRSQQSNHSQADPMLEKLQDIESTLAFQEEEIVALNKTIGRQHQDIQMLNNKLNLLSDYIKTLKVNADLGIKTSDEEMPPPHY